MLLWKQAVQQQLANQFGIEVLICHYPTGQAIRLERRAVCPIWNYELHHSSSISPKIAGHVTLNRRRRAT
jgi:hypothetical protein